jgi:D-3-phosphoglycerate dehydrogenase
MPPKVVITDLEHDFIDPELQVLSGIGACVEWHNCVTEDDVIRVAADADALLIAFAPITRRVLSALSRCRIVARYGIGVEMIDLEAATELGIVVTNVPDFCLDEVADHTLALLLACARKVLLLDQAMREGRAARGRYWDTVGIAHPVHRLRGQVLGIVGLGQIGRRVASRAQAFGLEVIAAPDPLVSEAEGAALHIRILPLDEVLRQADFLTLHVPLTRETHHLLSAERLALLKPSAMLINTSRGPVIDETALVAALRSGRLAAAGLDVFEHEPFAVENPLGSLPNVVLTSHAAWYSQEALYDQKFKASQAVVDALQGRQPRSVVNRAVLSQLDLAQRTGDRISL